MLARAVRDSRWDLDLDEVMRGVRETSVRCMEMVGCCEGRFDMMGGRERERELLYSSHLNLERRWDWIGVYRRRKRERIGEE